MKLTMFEIVNLFHELNGLTKTEGEKQEVVTEGVLKQKVSLKTKVYLQRLNKVVAEDYKLYEETRKELLLKYGKQEGNGVSIAPENFEPLNKELAELMGTEKEIEVSTLWSSDLTLNDFSTVETTEYYPVLFKLIDK